MSTSPRADPAQSARYLRHTQIDGFSQQAVAQCRVIVVGAGAIGNEVVKNLVLLGLGQQGAGAIVLYDFDRVEAHNLTRSVLLRASDIGQDKATCVARRAREIEPASRIDAITGDIADTLALADVADADIVISCVDNFEARLRVNQLAWLSGTPWINAAIDSRYASIEIFPFAAAQAPPCYECSLPASVYEKLAERRSCGGLLKQAQAQQVMPTTTLTTSLAGALAVNQALLLTGCDNRIAHLSARQSVRLFSDSLIGTTTRSELARASLCPCCDALPRTVRLSGKVRTAQDLLQIAQLRGLPGHTRVQLSDAIITRAECASCGPRANTRALTGRRAATVPDAVIVCAQCAASSVEVDIQDNFEISQLAALCADQPLPGNWAEINDEYLSLQGAANPDPSPPTELTP